MLSAGKYQNKAGPLFAENFPIRAELLAHAIVKVDLAKQIPIDQLFRIERLLENLVYSRLMALSVNIDTLLLFTFSLK